ncbi:hypothetical protein HK097_008895 [Rhizophlyctis rosea]|uniref:NodB homology domain-containing protein n=1 Tax=Rhizophlyctis rosea TaxID=64517 RepID=A0AAD5S9N4_9FUNG|nr:hypothetical protein HK097_008895 [Rhizophlyctis rosea]
MHAKLLVLTALASSALAASTCRPTTVTKTSVRTTTKTCTTTKSVTKTATSKVTSTVVKTMPAVTVTVNGSGSVTTVTSVSTVTAAPITITVTPAPVTSTTAPAATTITSSSSVPTSGPNPSCVDVEVAGDPYGCKQQAAWGNCDQQWMTPSGNCLASCGLCGTTSPMVTVYSKCTVPNTLALAFDDGTYLYQQQIIDAFNAAGFKTTFFTTGKLYQCIYTPSAVSSLRSAYATGHQIASHTWSHPDMTTLTQDGQTAELTKLDDALFKILGVKPTYLRPPYLAVNTDFKQVAYKTGFTHIITDDIDTQDWNGATVDASFNAVTQAVNADNSGHIVLAHEVYNGTALELVPRIIAWAKETGVKLVPVATCLEEEDESLWYKEVGVQSERDGTWVC